MSKIPEGTQFIEAGCGEKGFRKFEKGCWWFFEGFWRNVDWKMGTLTLVTEHPLYAAPTTQWNGDGLPPVGTMCESRVLDGNGHYVWREVKVIHHHPEHGNSAAIAHGDGKLLAWSNEFRPIRTAEQIAEEAREKAISKIIDDSMGRCDIPGAAYLYDAGYRCIVEAAK